MVSLLLFVVILGSPWYSLAKPSGGPPYVTGMPERPERPEMMPKPQGLIRKPKNYTPHILSPNTEATEKLNATMSMPTLTPKLIKTEPKVAGAGMNFDLGQEALFAIGMGLQALTVFAVLVNILMVVALKRRLAVRDAFIYKRLFRDHSLV